MTNTNSITKIQLPKLLKIFIFNRIWKISNMASAFPVAAVELVTLGSPFYFLQAVCYKHD